MFLGLGPRYTDQERAMGKRRVREQRPHDICSDVSELKRLPPSLGLLILEVQCHPLQDGRFRTCTASSRSGKLAVRCRAPSRLWRNRGIPVAELPNATA